MLAVIDKQNNEYVVQFDRHFSYSIEEVWSVLTENSKLKKWMSNLQIESLKTDGVIKFDMMDGSFINIDIIECQQTQCLNLLGIKIGFDLKYIKKKMVLFYSLKNTFMY